MPPKTTHTRMQHCTQVLQSVCFLTLLRYSSDLSEHDLQQRLHDSIGILLDSAIALEDPLGEAQLVAERDMDPAYYSCAEQWLQAHVYPK